MWMNGSSKNNRGGGGAGGGSTSEPPPHQHPALQQQQAPPREYPNLAPWCRVVVHNPALGAGAAGGSRRNNNNSNSRAPVQLPVEVSHYCQNVLATSPLPPKPYDFALEKQVVADTDDRRRQLLDGLKSTQSQDELKRSVLVKMKGVTNADETVCISLLESHSYDLKTSIEAYFQSPSRP